MQCSVFHFLESQVVFSPLYQKYASVLAWSVAGVLSMKLAFAQKQERQQVGAESNLAHLDSVRLLYIQAKLFITIQGLLRQTRFRSLGHRQETINNKNSSGLWLLNSFCYFAPSQCVGSNNKISLNSWTQNKRQSQNKTFSFPKQSTGMVTVLYETTLK